MSYYTSEAQRLETYERRLHRQRQASRPSFEVVEGSGLDSRVREGVSSRFVQIARTVIAVAVFVFVLGTIRVTMTALCAKTLAFVQTMRTDIQQAQSIEQELKVEQSILSNNRRIVKIATENYGMVPADKKETIEIPAVDTQAQASSENVR